MRTIQVKISTRVALSCGVAALLSLPMVNAATLYVDKNLAANCVSGNYSIANRDCTGTDGAAYNTVKGAIAAMVGGDDIILREGRYQEGYIKIPHIKSGTSNNWSSMQSFPGEWAILDGQRNIPDSGNAVIGFTVTGKTATEQLNYWRFERLEITGGGYPGASSAAGFRANGGPFHFKYVYIHDNWADGCNSNPGGVTGTAWQDSIIEYSVFENNGNAPTSTATATHNCGHINIYSDYLDNDIAALGFPLNPATINNTRNEYRYNLFIGNYVAIKYKNDQFFSGRNIDTGKSLVDDYKYYGDKIHHNIIINSKVGIDGRQDFIQIYNNILVNTGSAIQIGEIDTPTIYKPVVYNNTIISPLDGAISFTHNRSNGSKTGLTTSTGVVVPPYNEPNSYYGYAFNNILHNVRDGWNWSDIGAAGKSTLGFPIARDFSNLHIKNNYFYLPNITNANDTDGSKVVYLDGVRYTVSAYEALRPGSSLFLKTSGTNDLFKTGSVASSYKTNKDHVISGALTVANAGVGGEHPYFAGVSVPSYIGATDPNTEAAWVDEVLNLVTPGAMVDKPVNVAQPPLPLALSVQASNSPQPVGELISLSISVQNSDSTHAATNVVVDISLPSGVSVPVNTPCAKISPLLLRCTIANQIAAGAQGQRVIELMANSYGVHTVEFLAKADQPVVVSGQEQVAVDLVGNSAPNLQGIAKTMAHVGRLYSMSLTASDIDLPQDALLFSVQNKPAWASLVTLNQAVTLSGTPELTDVGQYDNILITVTDRLGASKSFAPFSIAVTKLNQAPVASAISVSTEEDTAVVIKLLAQDDDGDPLTYNVIAPQFGSISQNASMITYTPNHNYVGNDTFAYSVSDGKVASNTALVSIKVLNNPADDQVPVVVKDPAPVIVANHAPVAAAVNVKTVEDTKIQIELLGQDQDGDTLTYSVLTAQHGVVTQDGKIITYIPNQNYVGLDTFAYSVSDGKASSNIAFVTITVTNNPNDDDSQTASDEVKSAVQDVKRKGGFGMMHPLLTLMFGVLVGGRYLGRKSRLQ